MKILMTTDNIGGVWTYSLALAKGLQQYDIEVVLAIMGPSMSEKQEQEIEGLTWYFGKFKQEWMEEPWHDIDAAGNWLMEIKRSVKPDIIHLNSYSFGNLKWNVPVVVTLHSCVLSWWKAVKKETAPPKWNVYKQLVKHGINSADIVISPSKAMLDDAEKIYGPIKKKKVIYNGALQSKYVSNTKEKYVFSMGHIWDEAKNIKLVLKAAKEIKYPIYIAGDNNGVEPEEDENVNFLGHLSTDDVITWLSRASVYVLPVIYEPFGYTFLEAAFAGCAIVTGNINSMQEIWNDAAKYVDPDDSKALARNVNQLIENETFRQSMVSKSRKLAREKYSLDKMLSEYVSIYKALIPERKKIRPKSFIKTSKKKVSKL